MESMNIWSHIVSCDRLEFASGLYRFEIYEFDSKENIFFV